MEMKKELGSIDRGGQLITLSLALTGIGVISIIIYLIAIARSLI